MTSPRTLLGPLTTKWTAPAICSYAMALCDTCTTVWRAQTCNQNVQARDWTDCWPPRADSATGDPGVMMGWGFYSPAWVCPDGYTTAAMATAGGSSGWGVEYSMSAGETAAACCPSGFGISYISVSSTYAQTCIMTATSTSFSTVQCAAGAFTDFSFVQLPHTNAGSVRSSYVMYAPLFQLNFRESELPASVTTTSGGAGSPSSTVGVSGPRSGSSQGSSATEGQPSQTTALGDGGSGNGGSGGSSTKPELANGTKVGIALGVAAFVILCGAVFFLVFRRVRRRKQAATLAAGKLGDSEKNDGRPGVGAVPPGSAPEADGQEVKELEAISKPQEVMASVPAELPTTSAGGQRASRQNEGQVYELEADNPITTGRPWLG